MNSHDRYQAEYKSKGPLNRARRAKRHAKLMLKCAGKKLKVPHGTARQKRRQNMPLFQRQREAKLSLDRGTIRVNAPSLDMLNKYVGRVATKLDNLGN